MMPLIHTSGHGMGQATAAVVPMTAAELAAMEATVKARVVAAAALEPFATNPLEDFTRGLRLWLTPGAIPPTLSQFGAFGGDPRPGGVRLRLYGLLGLATPPIALLLLLLFNNGAAATSRRRGR
jgi:hypothetical protein